MCRFARAALFGLAAVLGGCSGTIPATADVAPIGDGGASRLFGDDCSSDSECVTSTCRPFQKGAVSKCTQVCDAGCPNPPSTGTCNAAGLCKF